MFGLRKQLAALTLALAMALTGGLEVSAVAPNNIITYQGRVLSANGVPVSDATLSMKFFLYTASSGGTCAWSNSSETCNINMPGSTIARTVTLTSGLFTQNLGSTADSFAAITDSVFADNATLYLEVIIGSETLSPRRLITAAPYALNSQTLDGLSSADFDLDRVYDNDSGSALAIDGASGLTFTSSVAANFTVNLASTGDFVVQDNGTAAVTVTDSGVLDVDGGVLLGDGGDTIAIDSSDWDISSTGAMTGISGITSDGLITGTLGATLSGAAISLNANSNFNTSINTGTSTGTVAIGGASSTLTLISNTLSLTDDNWVISTAGAATFYSIAASNLASNLNVSNNLLLNIGNAGTDFTADGGLTLAGDLTISGDDLFMGTNTSGAILVADGANFNPVLLSGDASVSTLGALSITADILDFADFEDTLDVDAATDVNLGANLFSIDLDSTGDFAVRDGTTNVVLFEDNSTVDVTFPAAGFLTIDASATANTTTTGVVDLNVGAGDAAVDALNIALTQNDGATDSQDATALEILLTGNDANGDVFGITVTGAATTNAARDTYEALLTLTNNENTSGAVTDAIRISSGASTADSIATGLDFDTTDITIDIEFQNADTLDNNTDGQFLFTRNTDADVTFMAADSSGATNLIIDTTGAGAITLGSADVASLTVTTDNGAATDVGITGGVTITSGATHNAFTIASTADTETAMVITADSLTTGRGLDMSVDALTTGTGIFVQSTSGALTSGAVGTFRHDGVYTTTTPSIVTLSGTTFTAGQNPTLTGTGRLTVSGNAFLAQRSIENQSTGTITESGALANIVRSETNIGGGTFNVTGAVLSVSSNSDAAVTDSGPVLSVLQQSTVATGSALSIRNDGIGTGLHLVQNTVSDPSANSVDRQALAIDVNEAANSDAVFLIRSDADGTPDTEFNIENDGDYQFDGTGSSPASDLAEVYPSSQVLVAGDLVALDPSGSLMIEKTTAAHQSTLLGAISTKPALRMGAEIAGYDVALIGRVPLKVSSENGSIAVGDPLTSSSILGRAMRATQAGMIVGYALESFSAPGNGMIMAFIDVGWSAGSVIGTDGTSTIATGNVVVAPIQSATTQAPTFDSFGLALRGSAWDGAQAQIVQMMLTNTVTSTNEYRLSVRNTAESEVVYITNEGTMKIAGDMVVGGHLYPSDRGVAQTKKYIYYDGSSGAAGDFMRTNAKGWATGSYDFAEMFPSAHKLMAGEVVAFAGDGEHVVRASGLDGEALAGIVSTRPGFLVGENVDGSYPIALAGRVPTRVSLDGGAIKVGDPLTAGASAGVAMKASKAGQVVGYALESFDGSSTDNLILTYVNVGYWQGGVPPELVDNRASEIPTSGVTAFSGLNMSGDVFMATHQILGIGRLEGMGALWSLDADGTLKTEGLVKTVITSYQNEKVETVATTSPQVLITLSGTSTLVEGRAEVRFEDIDPRFNDVISAIAPVRVLVTPSGPASIYVSEKDQNHFVATRFAGDVDVEFDWMAIAYRKGYERVEQEVVEGEEVEEEEAVEGVEAVEGGEVMEAEEWEAAFVEEEPAAPVSPDLNPIDQATQGDGGVLAEEPPQVVEDLPIDSPEEPPAP